METVVLNRAQAAPVVEYLESELRDRNPGLTFYISGPWRRGSEEIDTLVVVIKTHAMSLVDGAGNPTVVLPSALEHFEEVGSVMWDAKLRSPFGFLRSVFVLATPMQVGAVLWWTTGPDGLWTALKVSAKTKGLSLRSTGLFAPDGGSQLDDGTEYDIAMKLNGTEFLALVDPAKRENWVSVLREQMESTKNVTTIENVTSSDGRRSYEVWIDRVGRGVRCECKGFTYRGICKHLGEAEAQLFERGARPVEDRV